MNSITTTACSCCDRAKWHCPSCGLVCSWPTPTPAPEWPVHLGDGSCPRCGTGATITINGYGPQRPDVKALERALGLPPATKRKRR